MILQQKNYGLSGQSIFNNYDEGYDNFLGLGKKAKARREEKREDKKQKKEDNRAERLEKKELNNEKRRLKNEMKQTQIDEKKGQVSALSQVQQQPMIQEQGGGDNSMMIVAAVIGVVVIAGVGFVMMKKPNPVPAPVFAQQAYQQH